MPIRFDNLGRGPHDRAALLTAWGIPFDPNRDEDKRCLFWDDGHIAMFLTQNNVGSRHSEDTWLNLPSPARDTIRAQVRRRATEHNELLRSHVGERELGIFYRLNPGEHFEFEGLYEYRSERNEPDLNGLFFLFERVQSPQEP